MWCSSETAAFSAHGAVLTKLRMTTFVLFRVYYVLPAEKESKATSANLFGQFFCNGREDFGPKATLK